MKRSIFFSLAAAFTLVAAAASAAATEFIRLAKDKAPEFVALLFAPSPAVIARVNLFNRFRLLKDMLAFETVSRVRNDAYQQAILSRA